MALAIKDRVKETTTTTSTGTYTLAGAVTGFETFTANLSNGDTTYYACTDNTDFEVGIGTFTSSGTTLARTTILASSNSNSAVNWSSGTRTIFMTYPADKAVFKDASDNINGTFVGNITGNVTGNTSGTAATVTTAAQSNITSLGTLTTLTVDNVIINGTTIGHTSDTDLITLADGVATVAGEISVTTLDIGGTDVTSTAAELNILDGVTSTAAEINLIDGGTARGTTAVASGDGLLVNDGGTMRMTNVDTVSTYFSSHNVGGGNIVATGALNSGSITSGFGTIDTGSSAITTTGLISGGSLDIDNVLINGTTIGHTDDTDLITLADGVVTVAGEISVTTLDIGGTNVTSTAAELNILDGVTATAAEINIIDGVTATTAEINLIDGGTSRGTTAVASGDGILINDAGTMRMTNVDTVSTYFASHTVGGGNIVTTGALNSGSITSGFGTINNGSSAITTTGTITYGSLSDGTITITAFADEDDMSSDSATLVPTQQSVKAYVDNNAGSMTNFYLEDGDGTEVTVSNGKEVKFVEGGGIDINWTDTSTGSDGDPYDLTFTIKAAQTDITSLLATDIKIGEDDQTKIDFETADTINFYAGNEKQLILTDGALTPGADNILDLGSSGVEFKDAFFDGTVTSDAFAGPLTGDVTGNADTATALATARTIGGTSFDGTGNISVALATLATTVTITDNEDTDEDNAIIFTAGGDVDGGDLGLESDGTLTYNPSTGTVTATIFKGNIDAVDGDFDGTLEADAITIGGTGIGSIYSAIAGSSSIVTTGALNSGSITSGFGTIDTGSSDITTTGLISGGSLDIDDVVINGTTIGHTDDTDLITVANGLLSVAGDLTIISTAGGDGDNPSLVLYRNSGSPADSDDLAEILFRGRNDNSEDVEYAKIWAEAIDVSDGTEDGRLTFQLMNNGSLQSRLDFRGGSRTRFFNQDVELSTGVDLIFEGATSDAHETTVTVVDPTADRTITLPDATGTVITTGNLSSITSFTLGGTTPTLTIGDAGAEDTKLVFDGNAQDYHIGLDDSADDLVIGKGSTLGTTTAMAFDENGNVSMALQPSVNARAGAQVIATSLTTITNFTESYDIGSNFASGVFTAPSAGKYFASFHSVTDINQTAATQDAVNTGYFSLNDADEAYQNLYFSSQKDATIRHQRWGLSGIVHLDAGDTLRFKLHSGYIMDGQNSPLMIHKLS